MNPLAEPDDEDLAYVRQPVGRLGREHYATGRPPAGAAADERLAAAVRNANRVRRDHGTGHWTRRGEGGAEQ